MLGIVIANWNGEKLIGKCLDSISNQSYKDIKIYIIDNNSQDGSIKIIEDYSKRLPIKLTTLDYNSGFAVANNIGIKDAINDKCNYIFTLNNDVELEDNCLENAMKIIENNNKYEIFQLFMINYFDRSKCDAAGLVFDSKLIPTQIGLNNNAEEMLLNNIEIEGVCAGAAIYSSKALKKVQFQNGDFFDSNFFAYFEDVDLALRLRRAGFKAKLLKESKVYHMHSATGNKTSGFKEYYLARNLLLYTKRNQTLEEFEKSKSTYYVRFLKNIVKSKLKPSIVKSILKGISDGKAEMKNIDYIKD